MAQVCSSCQIRGMKLISNPPNIRIRTSKIGVIELC